MAIDSRDYDQNLPILGDFGNVEDQIEGEEQQFVRVIHGTKLKFTNDFEWVTGDGEPFQTDRELVIVDLKRVVQKWIDEVPVQTIPVPRGAKWPNVKKLNDECPEEEWTEKFGKRQGPYQASRIVYFTDPRTMERLTFPSSTWGADLAFREFRDAWNDMRAWCGDANIFAVITLSDTYMSTGFGGRQRPYYKIKHWIKVGSNGKIEAVIPLSALDRTLTSTIESPSLSQRMGGDEVPFK